MTVKITIANAYLILSVCQRTLYNLTHLILTLTL
jgi:hypothetical protein